MQALLDQLGLNSSFFFHFALFAIFFPLADKLFFQPFLTLNTRRSQRTHQDSQAADDLLAQAEEKLSSYQKQLSEVKQEAKQDYDAVLNEARNEEAKILAEARKKAKGITQEAIQDSERQKDSLEQQLEKDIDEMASLATQQLLKNTRGA